MRRFNHNGLEIVYARTQGCLAEGVLGPIDDDQPLDPEWEYKLPEPKTNIRNPAKRLRTKDPETADALFNHFGWSESAVNAFLNFTRASNGQTLAELVLSEDAHTYQLLSAVNAYFSTLTDTASQE